MVSVADSLDTRSAAGRLVLNIMVSVSQWEREAIGERTRDAMRHKRAVGECVGTVPYGYRVGSDGTQRELLATEQALLTRIRDLRAEGLSLSSFQRNRSSMPTWNGTRNGTGAIRAFRKRPQRCVSHRVPRGMGQ